MAQFIINSGPSGKVQQVAKFLISKARFFQYVHFINCFDYCISYRALESNVLNINTAIN